MIMKKLNNRQNQVKSLDFSNPTSFIFKDPKLQTNNLISQQSDKQNLQKSPHLIKGLIMGQTAINSKAAPQKSEIQHFNKKNQSGVNGLPPQAFGKLGSGATLSYVESSQSFKPSPVKAEGTNSKNFPLSIQKSSTHKAQKIKIGLHKKAASLMNSNQMTGHHSASAEPTNLFDFGKNNIHQNLKGGGLDSQKQSLLVSQQTSFNEYMSNNNHNNIELRQYGGGGSMTMNGPQVDNFLKATERQLIGAHQQQQIMNYSQKIHDSQLSSTNDNFININQNQAQANNSAGRYGFANTMNNQNVGMTQSNNMGGVKSFDQRSALGQIINNNQQPSQRASILSVTGMNDQALNNPINVSSIAMNNEGQGKIQAYRSHTNSFKNNGQVTMKHPQNKYVKVPSNINSFDSQSKQKKTLQQYHQRTLSDSNNQYIGAQTAQMFFNIGPSNQTTNGQNTNRQFQDLIRSVNEREVALQEQQNQHTIGFSSDDMMAGAIGSTGQQFPSQSMAGFTIMSNINQTQHPQNAKTTLGSSRQSVQSSTHLDDRDAIVSHYKHQPSQGAGTKEKYSDLKTIYNGMLRDQMQKTKQALKLTQSQFGGQSRKVVNSNQRLNANTQSYRASNYAPLGTSIQGSGTLVSGKLGRGVAVGDNKSTPKLVHHKKGKSTKMQSNNTSSQGNRSSNNTTQITNQANSVEKNNKKNNFLANAIVTNNTSMVNAAAGSNNVHLNMSTTTTTQEHQNHSNTNSIMMVSSIKGGQSFHQQKQQMQPQQQVSQVGHKRSISDGNTTFLSQQQVHKKAQNFSSVVVPGLESTSQIVKQNPVHLNQHFQNTINMGQIISGSAPISELSHIQQDIVVSVSTSNAYSKQVSHKKMSTGSTLPAPTVSAYEYNGKQQQQQQQQTHLMGKQSDTNQSILHTDRISNSSHLHMNQSSSNNINSHRQVSSGGGPRHIRHNSHQVAFDNSNKLNNGNPLSVPASTKKNQPSLDTAPSHSQQQQVSHKQSKTKFSEMVIEDQSYELNNSQYKGPQKNTNKKNSENMAQKKSNNIIGINEFQISEQKNNQFPQHTAQLKIVEERMETQDSAASDPNLSPRTKMSAKLSKKIRLAFNKTSNPPATSSDCYKIGKVMGKGAFGKVNLAVHRLSEKFVALKSINKQFLNEESSKRKVMQEFNILRRTRHKNVVRLYESFETAAHIVFVMEVCGSGDLLTYVRRRRKLKEDVAKHVFKQIMEGLKYCHSKNILHRDIKLDNILLTSEGDVKICDFGVSKLVKPGEIMTEQCGTPAYIAPEVFENKGYEGYCSDIWSAGVVLYAMLYGTVPFKASNMSELQKQITKGSPQYKEGEISNESLQLLKSILEKDPSKRLSINDILKHSWMQDIPEVSVFTEQEKEKTISEFAYYNFKNDIGGNSNEVVHTDPFTEQMLNSTQNSLIKNASTKSVILAPFNSTRSHIDDNHHMRSSIQDLMVDKKFVKFAAKVKEINRQYEMNNNAELDNGVYHQEDEEENKDEKKEKVNSLETSFDNCDKINLQNDKEAHNNNNNNNSNNIGDEEKKLQLEIEEGQKRKKQSEWQKIEQMVIDKQKTEDEEDNYVHSGQSGFNGVGIGTAQTLIINEKLLAEIEKSGYPRNYIIQSLNNDELNYATTFYYLLTIQKEY